MVDESLESVWCEERGSFDGGHLVRVERVGRELLLVLRRLAESERRATWWRSQGESDVADRYAAEARALREAVREFGGGA